MQRAPSSLDYKLQEAVRRVSIIGTTLHTPQYPHTLTGVRARGRGPGPQPSLLDSLLRLVHGYSQTGDCF